MTHEELIAKGYEKWPEYGRIPFKGEGYFTATNDDKGQCYWRQLTGEEVIEITRWERHKREQEGLLQELNDSTIPTEELVEVLYNEDVRCQRFNKLTETRKLCVIQYIRLCSVKGNYKYNGMYANILVQPGIARLIYSYESERMLNKKQAIDNLPPEILNHVLKGKL